MPKWSFLRANLLSSKSVIVFIDSVSHVDKKKLYNYNLTSCLIGKNLKL